MISTARNMPQKRLPAIAGRAVWEKVKNGRAGTRWKIVLEKVWEDIGGHQDDVRSIVEKFGGHEAEKEERTERRQRLALRNKVKRGGKL